ncbi:ribosomal oxygenase 1 [Diachasma alloeum]|uniref:ribosomal oxygenase 1 n=1 Tax=Diachasma alloeum TaxID=454923 RepID=UPI0007384EC0|nr:ribosomal oxygenase 1 [Diachasma alloeum]
MDNTKLVSAFAVHSKRRKSVDTVPPPTKVKRTRSSASESHKSPASKTPSKLSLSAHVAIEDIGELLKSTPKKVANGVESAAHEDEVPTPRKSGKKKKKTKSESSAAADESVGDDEAEAVAPVAEDVSIGLPQVKVTPKAAAKGKKEGKGGQRDKQSGKSQKQGIPKFVPDGADTPQQEEIRNNINPPEEAATLFSWVIHPLDADEFFRNNWEKAPLHIKRNRPSYYKLLMSTPQIDDILRRYHILFTKNLDITAYVNGKRETHNPEGRALPSVVWDYYANGCSVRMLNPQTFIPKLHNLNACLQEFFDCFVGANVYLTPPGSQGFAPHYDDIEAFILQIEGKKRWRLYKPRSPSEFLPRYSSKNFDPSELGEPILDEILSAGDLLYFPRGTIHQGETLSDSHSLHVTLSVYQKNCWGDFLEKLVPEALKTAIAEESEFREGMPLHYLKSVGSAYADEDSDAKRMIRQRAKELLHKMIERIDVDKAADQMAKGHIHDFLPPVLAPVELQCSVFEDGERMGDDGEVLNRVEIEPDTRVRLAREHATKLVQEEDGWKIYYSADNTKEYHEVEVQFLEVGEELIKGVKQIIQAYPDFVRVDDLEIEGEDNRVQVTRDLWEQGILLTDVPLPVID